MKTLTALVLLFCTLAAIAQPNPDTLWTRTYGGSLGEIAYDIKQTSDGGFIIAGYTYSYGAGDADFYVIKADAAGDTQWTKTYGGINDETAHSVLELSDGGYVILGYTGSFGHGYADIYLVRTNCTGDTLWTRTYGGLFHDFGSEIQQTYDGGYIIAGRYSPVYGAVGDMYLVKTDSSGDTLWTKTYGGTGHDIAASVKQTTNGEYIIAGWTESFGAGNRDFYLVKTNVYH